MTFRDENLRFAGQFDIAAQAFSTPVITVELGSDAARGRGNIAAFLLAVNLLSRTFDNVHAVFPDGIAALWHPWHLDEVGTVIDELSRTVCRDLRSAPPRRSDVVLSIGQAPSVPADRQVIVHGSYWRASLDCDFPGSGEGIIGSLYSACMGAAQVLLHVLHVRGANYRPMEPYTISVLDLRVDGLEVDAPGRLWIPETHLVGVGAVGSALVYTLAHFGNIGGLLHLIDNDHVADSNLNRYVLMRRQDIDRWKVDVASEMLSGTGIRANPYRSAYSQYVDEHGGEVGLLLSPVDSEEGRRGLAKTLPRRVINAATGGTTVTLSTHGFGDGKACLHCLYPVDQGRPSREEVMADDLGIALETVQELLRTNSPMAADLVASIEKGRGVEPGTWTSHVGSPIGSFYVRAVCGDANVRLPSADVIAPLSFISASAGVLLAAELVKAGNSQKIGWSLDNYFRVDTLHPPQPEFLRVQYQDVTGRCICGDSDYLDVYEQKYCPDPSSLASMPAPVASVDSGLDLASA